MYSAFNRVLRKIILVIPKGAVHEKYVPTLNDQNTAVIQAIYGGTVQCTCRVIYQAKSG